MAQKHIIDKFQFQTICAGVFKLIKEPALYRKYKKYLSPELFFQHSLDEEHSAFRKFIGHLNSLADTDGCEKFTFEWIHETLHSRLSDSKDAIALRTLYPSWLQGEDIQKRVNDENIFLSFIDYLKAIRIAQMSVPFARDFQSGKIKEAVNSMQEALIDINDMGKPDTEEFDPSDIFDMFSKIDTNQYKKLYLGNSLIDKHIGGFEPQTLNYFISVTGGGKSMMCHHLIRQCVAAQKIVHVSIVEDRHKSFSYRVVSAITGIPVARLKNEFGLLTKEETNLVRSAVEAMKLYVRVEFIYGQSVDVIHKSVLDKDLECKVRGMRECDVHIVDYTGHIAHLSAGDKQFEKMRRAYGARKDFALANSKICFDFAQVNREGDKRRQADQMLSPSDLAGSYDLAQIGDNIISINRSPADMSDNTAKLFICKARDGQAGGIFKINVEFDKARYNMNSATWTNGGENALVGALVDGGAK